ncbi:MAG: hypothetical protein IKP28_00600 [Clostridia bacterium]|nr:hypothetical protein [Clostridia bacterium]
MDFFAVLIRMGYIGNERYGVLETTEEMVSHIPELAITAITEVLVANILIAIIAVVVYIVCSKKY